MCTFPWKIHRFTKSFLSFFDLEEVVKMPSTPLDLLIVRGQFSEKDPVVIVSDGFSEQLMSQDNEVANVFRVYSKLFLLCIKGKDKEALSGPNQTSLEKLLEANFLDKMMIIESMADILKMPNGILKSILFEKEEMCETVAANVLPAINFAKDLQDNLEVKFESNKSVILINTIASTEAIKPVEILDENLLVYPKKFNNSTLLQKMNGVIQGDNLFEALSASLFVPNKSTAYVASTSGTSIHMANYIKYVVSKSGDGKLFKKLGSEKIRSYNASIVIDCSSLAFSEVNRVHSLITIFSIIRNLSNMQLPCIDLWVASRDITRIATGISSLDLWEGNILAALYGSLLFPSPNTCLPDCLRYASCTCNARSFESVIMVLTNGVLCHESRLKIKSIVSGIEMRYFGIGIGLYLSGFDDLFPTMIWSSNPAQLSETIMNLTNATPSGNLNAVPEHPIDEYILNSTFNKTFAEIIQNICSIQSIYEITLSNMRFADKTDEPNSLEKIDDINDSKYDLGVDGGFKDFSILFIILYLCRGERDENGKVIDEYITDEVLKNGQVINNVRYSPIMKLGNIEINGQPIGKGFNIDYAYDYKSAINKLTRNRYQLLYITCSPGDGIMAKACDDDVDLYADAFVHVIHEFNKKGGGVFWFLENYPYTYEADLYFKKYYGFEAVGDVEKQIKGGKVMERVHESNPKAGHFITIGGDATDIDNLSRLDLGIVRIFEGRTLCKLNEKKLQSIGFRIFARESEGNASIMVLEQPNGSGEGRMIIDTAASKLFLEFTEDGTARWISNAAVWLCNKEKYDYERYVNPNAKSGFSMADVTLSNLTPMEKREIRRREVKFCLSIVMDTTGSMDSYIDATKENIVQILEKLSDIEKENNLNEGGIVGQVVQYKDFPDILSGETEEYITNDFERLKVKLATFKASGGGDTCEDIQGGLIRALEQMEQSPYKSYNHLILIVADAYNHLGKDEDSACSYTHYHEGNKSFSQVWEEIYERIRQFKSIKIMFMPVRNDSVLRTARLMQSTLGKKIVDSAPVTHETDFAKVIAETAVAEYKRIIGIS